MTNQDENPVKALLNAAEEIINNQHNYHSYLTKASVAYGALYWPISIPGKYLFMSPQDNVVAIVNGVHTIPFGQELHLSDIQIVHKSILLFQIEILSIQKDELVKQNEWYDFVIKHPILALIVSAFRKLKGNKKETRRLPTPEDLVTLQEADDYYTSFITKLVSGASLYNQSGSFTMDLNGIKLEINSEFPHKIVFTSNDRSLEPSLVDRSYLLRQAFFAIIGRS